MSAAVATEAQIETLPPLKGFMFDDQERLAAAVGDAPAASRPGSIRDLLTCGAL